MGFFHANRTGAALLLACGLALAPAAAQAQLFGFWSYGFGAPEIGIHGADVPGIVADAGYALVARPQRNGRVFIADARDAYGGLHRLIISIDSGDIVQSFELGGPRPGRGDSTLRDFAARPIPRDGLAPIPLGPVPLGPVPHLGTAPLAHSPKARIARANAEPEIIRGITGPEPVAPKPARQVKPRLPKPPALAVRGKIEARPAVLAKPVVPVAKPAPASLAPPPAIVAAPAAPVDPVIAKPPPGPINDIPVAPLE